MSMQMQAQVKPTSASGSTPVRTGLLQRKCARSAMAGGECEERSKKKQLGLQTKLKVNEPGDTYEQEADRIADQMMATPAHQAVSGALPRIQHLARQPTGLIEASVDHALASPGRPLEPVLRQDMEPRFGHDFSQVRVHADAKAAESAQAVDAMAYTVGDDVVFGAGQYAPETSKGHKLIVHELTHTIQQKAAGMERSHTIMRQPSNSASASPLSLFPQIPANPLANCSAVSGDPFERQPAELQSVLRGSFGDAAAWFRGLGKERPILTSIFNRLCQYGIWGHVGTVKKVEPGEKPFLGVFEVSGTTGSVQFTTDKSGTLKSALLNTFRFCADSPLGGSQHKEQVSFREVSRSDSLHVAIGPGANFDAHIDRYSPAVGGGGNVCVYDPVYAAAHIGREVVPPKVRSYLGIPGVQIFPEPRPISGPPEREAPPPEFIRLEVRFPGL
ncbi:Uncharacterised protein [uncultured archaeon]|nr:Uncharacterised protein [uncultured archaeon]